MLISPDLTQMGRVYLKIGHGVGPTQFVNQRQEGISIISERSFLHLLYILKHKQNTHYSQASSKKLLSVLFLSLFFLLLSLILLLSFLLYLLIPLANLQNVLNSFSSYPLFSLLLVPSLTSSLFVPNLPLPFPIFLCSCYLSFQSVNLASPFHLQPIFLATFFLFLVFCLSCLVLSAVNDILGADTEDLRSRRRNQFS